MFAESTVNLTKVDGFAFASRKLPEYMHPRLLVCSDCGLLYGSPVLSRGSLAGAYRDAEFDSSDEAHFASATYAAEVRRVMGRLPDLNGALDIGTGDGAFVEALLGLGFHDVIGVEPSEAPVAAAKPEIRPRIRLGMFDADDFRPSSFALVSCFQTMEHVWDPLELVRGVYELIKPGGMFCMAVHNRKSISARILGKRSPIFDLEHLQLFCPSTARALLKRAGFRTATVSTLWNQYPIQYWVKPLPLPADFKRGIVSSIKGSRLGSIPLKLPPGNIFCVGVK